MDIDTRRQPLFHQRPRQRFGGVGVRPGRQHHDNLVHQLNFTRVCCCTCDGVVVTSLTPVPKEASRASTRRQPVPQPQRAARTRRIVRVLLLVFAGVIVVDAVVGERGLLARRRARYDRERLIAAIARVQGENERLQEVARRLKEDPAAIEEVARRELGMIRPGEKVFIIKDLPSPGTP